MLRADRLWAIIFLAATLASFVAILPAQAGPVLDRVRTGQVVRCGAEERPGFAAQGPAGLQGLAVDLCRAAALAVLGPTARTEFRLLVSEPDYQSVRTGALDLVFLSGGSIAEHRLAANLVPGPPVFVDSLALMVPGASEARRAADLARKTICFMIASPAQRALEGRFEALGLEFERLGFEEEVEMRDAFDVGRCAAVAGMATTLAAERQKLSGAGPGSRILDEPLALDPLFAMTGPQDGAWTAAIAWLIHGIVAASAPRSGWHGSSTGLDPEAAQALGLREHWREEITGILGSYADMLGRGTGPGSGLGLEPGPNAPGPAGLLLTPAVP